MGPKFSQYPADFLDRQPYAATGTYQLMSDDNSKHNSAKHPINLAGGLWIVAGLVGIITGVTLVMSDELRHLSSLGEASLAIGAGCLTMLAFAPWQQLKKQRALRSEIRNLASSLRQMKADRSWNNVKTLLNDRTDEFGDLSRAVHDALNDTVAAQLNVRLLRRTIDESIRRETHRATGQLRREVSTDPLTGLGNRRALEQLLEELLSPVSINKQEQVAALLIDIDQFKIINDQLGHEAGDQCLIFLASVLQSSLRQGDHALRIGGDEFIVLMPGIIMQTAQDIGQRISSLYSQMPWPHSKLKPPTLSIGVASASPGDLIDLNELIHRADTAMYATKRKDKNKSNTNIDRRGAA